MNQTTSTDTRSPQLIAAHANLAKASLDVRNETARALLKAHPEENKPGIRVPESTSTGYQYNVKVSYGGFLVFGLTVYFYDPSSGALLGYFSGKGGGLAVGGGDVWGTAWMNDTIPSLIGTDGTFEANFAAAGTSISLFDGNGNGLGTVVAGGVGVGIGIIGGKGDYES